MSTKNKKVQESQSSQDESERNEETKSVSSDDEETSISVRDIRSPSYGGSSHQPAELFRKDLISAMKVADSEQLQPDNCVFITDPWRMEWERGVQVPVNPAMIHEASLQKSVNCTTLACDFKIPKKLLHATKDTTYKQGMHELTGMTQLAEDVVRYDLDDMDVTWLTLLNEHRVENDVIGAIAIWEWTVEKLIEEFENISHEKMDNMIKTQEGLGIEYDEDIICDICRSPDSEDTNEMVFCDGCDICVHQACYGIQSIPDGNWLCRACATGVKPSCILCSNMGGAMKPTRSGTKWAHVSCALWIPEVTIGCVEKMEPVTKISQIPSSRWSLICYLCKERVGACIQCSVKTCKTAFHVTCAFKNGLEMKAAMDDDEGDIKLKAHCEKHSHKSSGGGTSGNESGGDEVLDCNMQGKDSMSPRKMLTHEEKENLRAERLLEIHETFYTCVKPDEIAEKLQFPPDIVEPVYHYWKLKRKSILNKPLLTAKQEEADMLEKQQEDSLLARMKMFVQLRQDLERVRNLCYMVSRREKAKREYYKVKDRMFKEMLNVINTEKLHTSGRELRKISKMYHIESLYDHTTKPHSRHSSKGSDGGKPIESNDNSVDSLFMNETVLICGQPAPASQTNRIISDENLTQSKSVKSKSNNSQETAIKSNVEKKVLPIKTVDMTNLDSQLKEFGERISEKRKSTSKYRRQIFSNDDVLDQPVLVKTDVQGASKTVVVPETVETTDAKQAGKREKRKLESDISQECVDVHGDKIKRRESIFDVFNNRLDLFDKSGVVSENLDSGVAETDGKIVTAVVNEKVVGEPPPKSVDKSIKMVDSSKRSRNRKGKFKSSRTNLDTDKSQTDIIDVESNIESERLLCDDLSGDIKTDVDYEASIDQDQSTAGIKHTKLSTDLDSSKLKPDSDSKPDIDNKPDRTTLRLNKAENTRVDVQKKSPKFKKIDGRKNNLGRPRKPKPAVDGRKLDEFKTENAVSNLDEKSGKDESHGSEQNIPETGEKEKMKGKVNESSEVDILNIDEGVHSNISDVDKLTSSAKKRKSRSRIKDNDNEDVITDERMKDDIIDVGVEVMSSDVVIKKRKSSSRSLDVSAKDDVLGDVEVKESISVDVIDKKRKLSKSHVEIEHDSKGKELDATEEVEKVKMASQKSPKSQVNVETDSKGDTVTVEQKSTSKSRESKSGDKNEKTKRKEEHADIEKSISERKNEKSDKSRESKKEITLDNKAEGNSDVSDCNEKLPDVTVKNKKSLKRVDSNSEITNEKGDGNFKDKSRTPDVKKKSKYKEITSNLGNDDEKVDNDGKEITDSVEKLKTPDDVKKRKSSSRTSESKFGYSGKELDDRKDIEEKLPSPDKGENRKSSRKTDNDGKVAKDSRDITDSDKKSKTADKKVKKRESSSKTGETNLGNNGKEADERKDDIHPEQKFKSTDSVLKKRKSSSRSLEINTEIANEKARKSIEDPTDFEAILQSPDVVVKKRKSSTKSLEIGTKTANKNFDEITDFKEKLKSPDEVVRKRKSSSKDQIESKDEKKGGDVKRRKSDEQSEHKESIISDIKSIKITDSDISKLDERLKLLKPRRLDTEEKPGSTIKKSNDETKLKGQSAQNVEYIYVKCPPVGEGDTKVHESIESESVIDSKCASTSSGKVKSIYKTNRYRRSRNVDWSDHSLNETDSEVEKRGKEGGKHGSSVETPRLSDSPADRESDKFKINSVEKMKSSLRKLKQASIDSKRKSKQSTKKSKSAIARKDSKIKGRTMHNFLHKKHYRHLKTDWKEMSDNENMKKCEDGNCHSNSETDDSVKLNQGDNEPYSSDSNWRSNKHLKHHLKSNRSVFIKHSKRHKSSRSSRYHKPSIKLTLPKSKIVEYRTDDGKKHDSSDSSNGDRLGEENNQESDSSVDSKVNQHEVTSSEIIDDYSRTGMCESIADKFKNDLRLKIVLSPRKVVDSNESCSDVQTPTREKIDLAPKKSDSGRKNSDKRKSWSKKSSHEKRKSRDRKSNSQDKSIDDGSKSKRGHLKLLIKRDNNDVSNDCSHSVKLKFESPSPTKSSNSDSKTPTKSKFELLSPSKSTTSELELESLESPTKSVDLNVDSPTSSQFDPKNDKKTPKDHKNKKVDPLNKILESPSTSNMSSSTAVSEDNVSPLKSTEVDVASSKSKHHRKSHSRSCSVSSTKDQLTENLSEIDHKSTNKSNKSNSSNSTPNISSDRLDTVKSNKGESSKGRNDDFKRRDSNSKQSISESSMKRKRSESNDEKSVKTQPNEIPKQSSRDKSQDTTLKDTTKSITKESNNKPKSKQQSEITSKDQLKTKEKIVRDPPNAYSKEHKKNKEHVKIELGLNDQPKTSTKEQPKVKCQNSKDQPQAISKDQSKVKELVKDKEPYSKEQPKVISKEASSKDDRRTIKERDISKGQLKSNREKLTELALKRQHSLDKPKKEVPSEKPAILSPPKKKVIKSKDVALCDELPTEIGDVLKKSELKVDKSVLDTIESHFTGNGPMSKFFFNGFRRTQTAVDSILSKNGNGLHCTNHISKITLKSVTDILEPVPTKKTDVKKSIAFSNRVKPGYRIPKRSSDADKSLVQSTLTNFITKSAKRSKKGKIFDEDSLSSISSSEISDDEGDHQSCDENMLGLNTSTISSDSPQVRSELDSDFVHLEW